MRASKIVSGKKGFVRVKSLVLLDSKRSVVILSSVLEFGTNVGDIVNAGGWRLHFFHGLATNLIVVDFLMGNWQYS